MLLQPLPDIRIHLLPFYHDIHCLLLLIHEHLLNIRETRNGIAGLVHCPTPPSIQSLPFLSTEHIQSPIISPLKAICWVRKYHTHSHTHPQLFPPLIIISILPHYLRIAIDFYSIKHHSHSPGVLELNVWQFLSAHRQVVAPSGRSYGFIFHRGIWYDTEKQRWVAFG